MAVIRKEHRKTGWNSFTKIARMPHLEKCGGLTAASNAEAMFLGLLLKEPRLERPEVSPQKFPSPYEKRVEGGDDNLKIFLSIPLTSPMSKTQSLFLAQRLLFPWFQTPSRHLQL